MVCGYLAFDLCTSSLWWIGHCMGWGRIDVRSVLSNEFLAQCIQDMKVLNQNFCALDLELNHNPQGEVHDIIEVGICIGSIATPREEWIRRNWYLKSEYPIATFINELTGITDETIEDHAVSVETLSMGLKHLLEQYNCFHNPVVWGHGDDVALKEMFVKNNIEFEYFGHRNIDVKTIHTFLSLAKNRLRKEGLKKVMNYYKMEFEGEQHRASVDAYNTLRLFFKLLDRQCCLDNIAELSAKG